MEFCRSVEFVPYVRTIESVPTWYLELPCSCFIIYEQSILHKILTEFVANIPIASWACSAISTKGCGCWSCIWRPRKLLVFSVSFGLGWTGSNRFGPVRFRFRFGFQTELKLVGHLKLEPVRTKNAIQRLWVPWEHSQGLKRTLVSRIYLLMWLRTSHR